MFPNQQRAVERVGGALRRGASVYLHGDPGAGVTTVLRAATADLGDVLLGTVDLAAPEVRDDASFWERLCGGFAKEPALAEAVGAARAERWSSDGLLDLVAAAQRRGFPVVARCEHFDRILDHAWAAGTLVKLRKLGQEPSSGGRPPFVLAVGAVCRALRFNQIYALVSGDRRSPFNHLQVEEIEPLTAADVADELRDLVRIAGYNPRLLGFARAHVGAGIDARRAGELVQSADPIYRDLWALLDDDEVQLLDLLLAGAVGRHRGRQLPDVVMGWVEERARVVERLEHRGLLALAGSVPQVVGALHLWWFIDQRFTALSQTTSAAPGGLTWSALVRQVAGPQPTLREAVSWLG